MEAKEKGEDTVMKKYEVINKDTGVILGEYYAVSASRAIKSMLDDAGDSSEADASIIARPV